MLDGLKIATGTASLAVLLAVGAASPLSAQSASGVVRVEFSGLRSVGEVRVALFESEAAWKTTTQAVRSATVPVHDGVAAAVFEGLAPGAYGVMAYHDRNANKKLDTLPIGMPTEPYGFSRNARGMFGPPAWKKASFTLGAGETDVEAIALK
jgi:uncharacterized protein (DUF2141 family)